ncbi:MAG: hypothetical protein HXY34_00540 [Candidatus Thorarchaeota archaeon]|nr:hypothetical protein [Candidatus Thorarchaeota archaeon]
MVRTLFDYRGRGTRNLCASCGRIRRVSEMVLCHRCFGPVCAKCQKVVLKSDGTSEILCSKCIKEMFG